MAKKSDAGFRQSPLPLAGDMVKEHGIFMNARLKLLVIACLMPSLAACAGGEGRYPSLALRPFETAPPAPPTAVPAEPIRPLVDEAALSALLARATSAHAAFTGKQAEAQQLARAAAGQSIESNTRAAALVTMADLAAQRGATSAVLAELDLLAVQSAASFAPTQDIDDARAKVLGLIEGQDIAMARLWAVLET